MVLPNLGKHMGSTGARICYYRCESMTQEERVKLRFIRIGYAYTPTPGKKPVDNADVEINGRPHHFEKRANDVFETAQLICVDLGIPFQAPQFSGRERRYETF